MIKLTLGEQIHTLSLEDARLLSLALTSLTGSEKTSKQYRVRSSVFTVERNTDIQGQASRAYTPLTDC